MRNPLEVSRRNRGSSWDLMNQFDDIFEQFRNQFFPTGYGETAQGSQEENWLNPQVQVQETDEAFLLNVDLPGVKKEDVRIHVSGRTLMISGERKSQKEIEQGRAYRMEKSYGKFSRQFALPENVNPEQIEANLEDGVLMIALPKSEVSQARSIEIGAGKGTGFFSKFLGGAKKAEGETQTTKQTH